jgi:hypothetical protein
MLLSEVLTANTEKIRRCMGIEGRTIIHEMCDRVTHNFRQITSNFDNVNEKMTDN